MDCKFIKQIDLITYTFNHDRSSIFYLVDRDTRLRIYEQNLLTGMILNHFQLPNKQRSLQADNCLLSYNRKLKCLILTLSYHLLIFSLTQKSLIFMAQCHGKNPYIITSVAMSQHVLFFSAFQQRNVYCINLQDCISSGSIPNFTKLKIPKQVQIIDLKCWQNRLVAACSDRVIRIWNTGSLSNLRGMSIQESTGDITALAFSRDGSKFMAATDRGMLYVWDGRTLGSNNTLIMSQKISDKRIVSISWFHYGGEFQSKRLIVMTADGSIRLFSFSLEKTLMENKEVFIGRAIELCSLFKVKSEITRYMFVSSHPYSNHICFNPGRILYLVDYHPYLYYPIVQHQYTHSFQSLVPMKSQIFWQRELFFIEGLQIKRLKEGVQKKLSLNSVLEYQGLKILKMESRPLTLSTFKKAKFLINYYLGNMTRVLLIYKVNLAESSDVIEFYKQYQCNMGIFLGPSEATDPLVFLLTEDRQSVSVMLDYQKEDRDSIIASLSKPQQKNLYKNSPGELVNINLKIKIQKVYRTPLRNSYVVLYRSENLLRFSKNRNEQNQLLDYQVLNQPQLRIDYSDIIIDVVWCNSQQTIGAVVCLDKVLIINGMLKVLKIVNVSGYVTQGQWQGYTLFLTTKVGFAYVTIDGNATELFSLETQEEKTMICMIMVDRIITAGKTNLRKKDKQQSVDFKTRYFNLMEPLLAGYISYCNEMCIPFEPPIIKTIVQSFVPYYKVSSNFLTLLNQNKLMNFSNYFIELNPKCYQIDLKLQTFCTQISLRHILKTLFPTATKQPREKDFWKQGIYRKQKKALMFLYQWVESTRNYDQTKPSPQSYLQKLITEVQLPKETLMKFKEQCMQALDSKQKVVITMSFGEKMLTQCYKDEANGEIVNMTIEGFQVDSVGQWIGLFSTFVEAKVSSNKMEEAKDQFFEEPEGEFTDLIAYYRFDQGKGQSVEDLSDYTNNSTIANFSVDKQDIWNPLEDEPLEVEDKWGKKCPPQFSIKVQKKYWIERAKHVNFRPFNKFTIQIWVKTYNGNGVICSFGESTVLLLNENKLKLILQSKQMHFTPQRDQSTESDLEFPALRPNFWQHICVLYEKQIGKVNLFINCLHRFEANITTDFNMPFGKELKLGSDSFDGELTEFRLWKNKLSLSQVKDCFRSPLSIVSEKRKKLKMKLKEKKQSSQGDPFGGISFDPKTIAGTSPDKGISFEPPPGVDWGFPM